MIIANEATAKGGSTGEAGLWKNRRLAEVRSRPPDQHSAGGIGGRRPSRPEQDSFQAGADFAHHTPVETSHPHRGGRLWQLHRRGAYLPGMSDYVVMVKKQAQVFLAGPPLVKMATGEVATEEELGGAEMHSRVCRPFRYLAEDELDGNPYRARSSAFHIKDRLPQKRSFGRRGLCAG